MIAVAISCCFVVLPVIVSFEVGKHSLISKLHCAADVQLSVDWRSHTHLECLQQLPLGICIIVMLSESSWF